MSVTIYSKLKFFAGKQLLDEFFCRLKIKNCVQKCNSSPKITVGVGQCEFRYNIVNFNKKRSGPKEIPLEVEVSVVKMIVISQDDCNYYYDDENPLKILFSKTRRPMPFKLGIQPQGFGSYKV